MEKKAKIDEIKIEWKKEKLKLRLRE